MMTIFHRSLILASILAAANVVQATEKQSLTIAEPLKSIAGLPLTDSLSESQAKALVTAILPGAKAGAIMIHAVKYQTGKLAVDDQNWYTVNLDTTPPWETVGDLHRDKQYKSPRMFGVPHLGLVYVHILEGATAAAVETQLRTQRVSDSIRANHAPLAKAEAGVAATKLLTDIDTQISTLTTSKKSAVLLSTATTRLAMIKALSDGADKTAELAALWADLDVESVIAQLLTTGASGQVTLVADSDSAALAPLGDVFVKKPFTALSTLSYGISIQSKDKAPFANLKSIAGTAFGFMSVLPLSIRVSTAPLALAAGALFDTTLTTSDVVVTATYSDGGKDTQIGTQTYDNEGRYWYDFSFLLPFSSYKNLTYDSTANGLTAHSISKNNLYGAINIGLPRDTKNMKLQLIPVLLYGIPITGQPLQHHLFAASIGLNYVNFFAGTELDAKNFYHNFSQPLTGDNVFRVWRTHLVYGINFDVATITKALSKSTSASK